ncbi:MAG TPA: PQQ-dependent sugar dehydrogenase [bacterium]
MQRRYVPGITHRWLVWSCAALALSMAACTSSGGGGGSDGMGKLRAFQVELEDLFPGVSLDGPMVLLQAPDDPTHWYVFERGGQVWQIAATALAEPVDFGAVPNVDTDGEGGLLGAAFHPNYPATQQVFLSYTIEGSGHPMDSIISRVGVSGGSLDMAGEDVLLTVHQPETNHTGGNTAFGPDDMLYIGFGDGGGGGDNHGDIGNGQDRTTLLGKMLRINVTSGDTGYTIPDNNPFAGNVNGWREEIYAYGFRNPFRWSFDKALGDLWVGDVGQNAYEEVDKVASGGNYGWRVMEGLHCYNASDCNSAGFKLPVLEYPHNEGNCSITGGFIYRGTAYPKFAGYYFYGDFCGDRIYAYDTVSGAKGYVAATGFGVTGFAQGLDGELYVLDLFGGHIYHIVPAP